MRTFVLQHRAQIGRGEGSTSSQSGVACIDSCRQSFCSIVLLERVQKDDHISVPLSSLCPFSKLGQAGDQALLLKYIGEKRPSFAV